MFPDKQTHSFKRSYAKRKQREFQSIYKRCLDKLNDENPVYRGSVESTKELIYQFMSNLEYLRKRDGLSRPKFIEKYFTDQGIECSLSYYVRLLRGERWSVKLMFMILVANAVGEPLIDLLIIDYASRDHALGGAV